MGLFSKGDTQKARKDIQWAIALQQEGRFSEAQDTLERTVKALRGQSDALLLATAISQLAQVFYIQGKHANAMAAVRESAMIRTKNMEPRGLAVDYQLIGNLFLAKGLLDQAQKFFSDALGLALSIGEESLAATAEANLGLVSFNGDDFDRAEEHFQRSNQIRRKINDELGIARNLNHLGRVKEERGDLRGAETLFVESLKILQNLGAAEGRIAEDNIRRLREKLNRDARLIGSDVFPAEPKTARGVMRPMRSEIQRKYREEGRHPDELAKVAVNQRDESFWMTYIDALMVFEREKEAQVHIENAILHYPSNPLLAEMRQLLRTGRGLHDDA